MVDIRIDKRKIMERMSCNDCITFAIQQGITRDFEEFKSKFTRTELGIMLVKIYPHMKYYKDPPHRKMTKDRMCRHILHYINLHPSTRWWAERIEENP